SDPAELQREQVEFTNWRINNCFWKQNLFTNVKALQVFWLPRPGPDRQIGQHWLVRVAGLAVNDSIIAWDGERGRRLAQVRASTGGETEISLVMPPERFTRTLLLTLNDAPFLPASEYAARVARLEPPAEPGPHDIDSVQTVLVPMSTIHFDAEVE